MPSLIFVSPSAVYPKDNFSFKETNNSVLFSFGKSYSKDNSNKGNGSSLKLESKFSYYLNESLLSFNASYENKSLNISSNGKDIGKEKSRQLEIDALVAKVYKNISFGGGGYFSKTSADLERDIVKVNHSRSSVGWKASLNVSYKRILGKLSCINAIGSFKNIVKIPSLSYENDSDGNYSKFLWELSLEGNYKNVELYSRLRHIAEKYPDSSKTIEYLVRTGYPLEDSVNLFLEIKNGKKESQNNETKNSSIRVGVEAGF